MDLIHSSLWGAMTSMNKLAVLHYLVGYLVGFFGYILKHKIATGISFNHHPPHKTTHTDVSQKNHLFVTDGR